MSDLVVIEREPADEVSVVVITDADGNEYNFVEEFAFSVDGVEYAILVELLEDCGCEGEHDHEEEEPNVILAKVVLGEDGEVEYIEPTEEEFEVAEAAYNEYMDKLEEE